MILDLPLSVDRKILYTFLTSIIAYNALTEEYKNTFLTHMFHICKWGQQIHFPNMSMLLVLIVSNIFPGALFSPNISTKILPKKIADYLVTSSILSLFFSITKGSSNNVYKALPGSLFQVLIFALQRRLLYLFLIQSQQMPMLLALVFYWWNGELRLPRLKMPPVLIQWWIKTLPVLNFWRNNDDDWAHGGALFDVTKSDILENNQYQAWKR